MFPETIETGRLRLRAFAGGDRVAVERALGRWEVARMMTSVPHPYPRDGFAMFLDRVRRDRAAGGAVYAVEAEAQLVGCVALSAHVEGMLALGYWVAPQAWGRGMATEAAAAARDAAFSHTSVPALFARRFHDNPASARVLEKLGFVQTGTLETWSEPRRARTASLTYRLDRDVWARARVGARTLESAS